MASEVTRAPRRPISVLVVVYTRQGEVLALKRTRPFEFWQSITGSLLDGETHAQAAARELEEETGLCVSGENLTYTGVSRVFVIDSRWRHRYPDGIVENVEFEWHLCLDSREDVRLNPAEHSKFEWLHIDEAIERFWSWTNVEALQGIQRNLPLK